MGDTLDQQEIIAALDGAGFNVYHGRNQGAVSMQRGDLPRKWAPRDADSLLVYVKDDDAQGRSSLSTASRTLGEVLEGQVDTDDKTNWDEEKERYKHFWWFDDERGNHLPELLEFLRNNRWSRTRGEWRHHGG